MSTDDRWGLVRRVLAVYLVRVPCLLWPCVLLRPRHLTLYPWSYCCSALEVVLVGGRTRAHSKATVTCIRGSKEWPAMFMLMFFA